MGKANYSLWIKIIVSFFLCCGIAVANNIRTYTKYWAVANIIGSISEKSSFKYYLEPQLRLIDTPSVFNQVLLLAGLGYQFTPDVMLFIGPGWVLIKTPESNTYTEKRLWEQLNWRVVNNSNLSLNNRTRLEERQRSDQSQTAFRLRERLWLRVPLKNWQSYSFSCYDELFFNLNRPYWASPYLFEQNRAFIGIAKHLSKSAILDIGYMNQFFHLPNNQTDNVIVMSFTMIT